MVDVVTIGESMVLFQPMQDGSLAHAPLFTQTIAGAESNVAIGLTRLGKKVRWISKLGTDAFGDKIKSTLAGEGIDISCVIRDDKAPTAVYFKEFKGYGDPNIYYYRRGSAASTLSAADITPSWLEGARHLHVTGITPALGEGTAEMICEVMRLARKQGMTISFDPNLRRKLWDEETARTTLLSIIPLCDIFMPGIEEAEFLLGSAHIEEMGRTFLSRGPKLVAMKLGAEGSIGMIEGHAIKVPGQKVKHIVDTVGAGDAFATGFLSCILDHEAATLLDQPSEPSFISTIQSALNRGNIMGALAVQYKGDWEGLPTLREIESLASGQDLITR